MIIDYSTARPTVATLKAGHVTAVGRYIGWDSVPGYASIGKNISRAEAQALTGAGIAVFLAFEYAADAALSGSTQGTRDAQLATQQLHELGAPADMTVYFAVDFDIADYAPASTDPRAKLGPAAAYFEAVNAARPAYKVGVYGGYWAVRRVLDAGLAHMGWQTVAWSGGQWDTRAVLRQLASQVWGTADINLHAGSSPDFGQWPRPAPPTAGPYRHVATGGESYDQIAAGRNWDGPDLLGVSLAHWTAADRAAVAKLPLAAGWPYYTLRP